MSLWTQHEALLERLRLAIPGGPPRWHPHRLIFRDWWYWRDQELGFAHGRLGLTGPNGSGKSTLLALVLPTLLDGDTSPRRLDPAESRDRQLDYYLLGEESAEPGGFRYEARTGYVALEFRHGSSGRYLTIGMGVSASRARQRRLWWGFVVPDRRLGQDFEVRGPDGSCLGYRELARQLESPAVVTTDQGEYRRRVNAQLFGMPDDDYRELIRMLLAARRPKLGEQRGPEEVCQRLLESLPGIPQDRLERVAEVVHNIEEYQRNLEDIAYRVERVEAVDRRLQELAAALVQEAAAAYGQAVGKLGHVAGQLKECRESMAAAETELENLQAAMAVRQTRLAEVDAELEVLRAADDADLPAQLGRARAEAERLGQRRQVVATRLREQQAEVERLGEDLRHREELFRKQSTELRGVLEELAGQARELRWDMAERALAVAAADLRGIRVTCSSAEILAAQPDPSLPSEGTRLAQRYRELGAKRRQLAAAEAACRQWRHTLDVLRRELEALGEREEQAAKQMEAAREELVRQLGEWRETCSALQVPEQLLARLVGQVRELSAPPESVGFDLLAPLRAWATSRRRELEDAQQEAMLRQGRAERQLEEMARRMEEFSRTGPLPDRSALRAAARAERDEPLFRWVRFRPEVDPDVAAMVEAAALEANLLDLLLQPVGDAYALAAPLQAGPTLLEVMEPEPGAPPEVRAVLASVGWGEGAADRWITADGRWRNGLASGQVAPWLTEAPGLVGEQRRLAFARRRLGLLEQQHAAAREAVDRARDERDGLAELASMLERELDRLQDLPWQPLFGRMVELTTLSGQLAQTQACFQQAREAAAAAMKSYHQEEQAYEAALTALPAARGLDDRELDARAAALDRLLVRLQTLRYRELADLADHHRELRERLRRDREVLESLRQDLAGAQEEEAAAGARVKALDRRLADPEVDALHRRMEGLCREQRELRTLQEEAARRLASVQGLRQTLAQRAAMLEPEVEELRAEQTARLERLRTRLRLHPGLEEHLRALDAEGPVVALARLPRPLDPQSLEEGIGERRAALQSELNSYRDALGDYRPTPDPRWETVTFYEADRPLAATELALRLREAAAKYQQLIAEEERQLYENIIYQGMLDELGRLVRRAREFTDNTNARLRTNPLSSGEWFSLRLSLQPVESSPGAAIARTLEEAGQGTDWLSAERREGLLDQVRAEVERVRKEAQARGEELSYYEVIARALDYRRWYSYRLLSHRGGTARPINQRGFGARSTSEKAWALAVPLIAGVAARYDAAAKKDAPRMIALDEAFAGFDSANQVGYLRLLSDLGLDWIITCPDELPYHESLSAAMAYRLTLDGTVHTAFPILWDGRQVREPLAAATGEQP